MKQKGFIPILLVILVAAAALGGYFIYQKQTQPTPSPQPSPISDPTANWKTCVSLEGGYKIQYPDSWIDNSSTSIGSEFCAIFQNQQDGYVAEGVFASINRGIVTVETMDTRGMQHASTRLSEQEFFNPQSNFWLKTYSGVTYSAPTPTTVGGRKAMKQTFNPTNLTTDGHPRQLTTSYYIWLGNYYTWLNNSDDGVIRITFQYVETNPNKEALLKTFDQILSTFKLLDQAPIDTDKKNIKELINNFYQAFDKKDGKLLFSYMSPPETPQEKGEYSWLTGADLGANAFDRVFLRVKLTNPSIKGIGARPSGDINFAEVNATDELRSYSQTTTQWSKPIVRDIKFTMIRTQPGWAIYNFTSVGTITGTYKGTEKYSGFPNLDSN